MPSPEGESRSSDDEASREVIYDPCLGSGTTVVAAEQLGRRCNGIEILPAYVAVCLERLALLGLEPRLEG
jgi:DNA modification methylase